MPGIPAVDGHEEAEFRAQIEQILADGVLDDRPSHVILRQVTDDGRPSLATIIRPQNLGAKVSDFVTGEHGVDPIVVMVGSLQLVDEGRFRAARKNIGPLATTRRRLQSFVKNHRRRRRRSSLVSEGTPQSPWWCRRGTWRGDPTGNPRTKCDRKTASHNAARLG